MVYLVTYDLIVSGQNYEGLHKLIKEVSGGEYVHIMQSVFIIKSSLNAEQIIKALNPAIDKNDFILVSEITRNTYGTIHKDHWPLVFKIFGIDLPHV